ncbi:efflux RND transporter permease subunit [Capnocytophaga sp. H2931]|uniref:efflux RND transporter permease subunit n=1 Tax=Capnocytophaga sp. H2931 TaxID=1945657 RepID=UPI000BB191FC|nr:efflux RND transporter permease subunit [Capnocytophaga sp. H2931]ATA75850.1 cation transporter [Capnocytophaga sp. H2931]
MIKFLLTRPIAVLMSFLGLIIVGAITFGSLPVSLLPDIPIPEITVQVTGENVSARELENTVVTPIRQQLLQVGKLRDITSETRDGNAIIRLKFDYGTNTDLAFIEVNEKIDGSMSRLPRNTKRPQVVKASATDIPVFYLNLSLKDEKSYSEPDEQRFLELSEFSQNIVKRRVEQLPEVAMADITGYMQQHIRITPNMDFLETIGLQLSDIENTLQANNVEPGSMVVRDGYYEYNIKFSSVLRTIEDVKNIYFRKGDRLLQLKDFAQVELSKKGETGLSVTDGKRSVTLAIIKQSDETMQNLKESLYQTLDNLEKSYPDVQFSINRNQTELLDYTISNLNQNLFLGFVLVFLVAIFFLGDAKSPMIIGLSMFSALIISFVFFYLFDKSLNIISLSGMILALGMMIDSAIIVTDIITQHREKGETLFDACVKGTNEVITPILSSTFTTIAVFLPLIFLSGISGAIFLDQAFAVSVGLLVSYFTGIILLPILYHTFYHKKWLSKITIFQKTQQKIDKILFSCYDKGFKFIFSYKKPLFLTIILMIPLCVLLFRIVPKTNMPHLDHIELIAKVEWNENIHIDENKKRTDKLFQSVDEWTVESAGYIGNKQYLLEKENNLSITESEVYFKANSPKEIEKIKENLSQWMHENYPQAVLTFAPPKNIFEKIFDTNEADIIAQLYSKNRQKTPSIADIKQVQTRIKQSSGVSSVDIAFEEQFVITVDKEKLLRYKVDYSEVHRELKTAFKNNEIATLRSYQQYLPITLSGNLQTINQVLQNTMVRTNLRDENEQFIKIPLQSLLSISKGQDLKTIVSGKNGEYIPLVYPSLENAENFIQATENELKNDSQWEVQFAGGFFSSQKMLGELVVVLIISVLLMYFILAAQFESFTQPLIVLAELPVDIAFALLLLWGTGHTLNLMSAIGIVVSCGIIINDSILKIDMINELRKANVPLMEAIHTAGQRRLRSIMMTSLTTILAMTPLLFSFDMGSELQKPLAVAMIGTMMMGTLVSLFIIPLIYWLIYRDKNK